VPVTDLARRREADELVHSAHLGVHRYPPDFPGFGARVRATDGDGTREGLVTLRPGARPVVEPAAPDWVDRELGSLADHRWHRAYDLADGRFDKDLSDEPEALGRKVSLDDPMRSSYWIHGGRISRISRTLDDGRFSILIQDHMTAPDGGTVATHFVVVHEDEVEGRITATEAYRDEYEERWGLLLPALRRVVTITGRGAAVRELRLSGHRRLAPTGTKAR